MFTSRVTRSGGDWRMNSSAFSPLQTEPTTRISGRPSSASCKAARKMRESSTIRTRRDFGVHAAEASSVLSLNRPTSFRSFLADLVELLGGGVDPRGRLVGRPGGVADAVDVGGNASGRLGRFADVARDIRRTARRLGHVARHVSRRLGHLGDRAGDVADALVRLSPRSARSSSPPVFASPPTLRFYQTRR